MAEQNSGPATAKGFGKVKKAITLLTGVLLVIPAFINAGVDVYESIMNISPAGSAERLNEKMRSKHFQEEPLFSEDFEVPKENTRLILRLFVYPNADLLVNYAGFEQWLPAEQTGRDISLLPVLSSAYAAEESDFGYPKAIITPREIRGARDLQTLQQEKLEKTRVHEGTITRSYWFEEQNDSHSGFSASSKQFTKRFEAVEGYKITDYRIETATINKAKILSSKLAGDGSHITVTFEVESGPLYSRWKGWIKAQVITTQRKAGQ